MLLPLLVTGLVFTGVSCLRGTWGQQWRPGEGLRFAVPESSSRHQAACLPFPRWGVGGAVGSGRVSTLHRRIRRGGLLKALMIYPPGAQGRVLTDYLKQRFAQHGKDL